jgi:hypothetical protein
MRRDLPLERIISQARLYFVDDASRRCPRSPRALVLAPVLLLACHAGIRHDHSRLPPPSATLTAGTYDLLLTSTSGFKEGRSARGRLILRPTSADDVSPRTGEGPREREDRARTPLYGSTDLRFQDVNAPVHEDDPSVPSPRSIAPIYPGVRVETDCGHDGEKHICLWIGTNSNDRTGVGGEDGAGIVLWVEWIDGPAFGGVWSHWGIVVGDTGTWTAKRVRARAR